MSTTTLQLAIFVGVLFGVSPNSYAQKTSVSQGCAASILDQASPATCIKASTQPALGFLYPLNNNLFITSGGHIGINTLNPKYNRLRIRATANHIGLEDTNESGATEGEWTLNADSGQLRFTDESVGAVRLMITSTGTVGINTATPKYNQLRIRAQANHIGLEDTDVNGATAREWSINADSNELRITNETQGKDRLVIADDGIVTVRGLRITGGADVAEPFRTKDAAKPGSIVCVDPSESGSVLLSRTPYDGRVIGVVSGAGSLSVGVQLCGKPVSAETAQESVVPVAASGRAYVLASLEGGVIEPGDLLTTSSTAGTAMKATDRALSFGSTIGKALSRRDSDTGLVLAWVNLQ
ncbi:MAG: hypothetical protein IPH13_11820 [Planctomycetes bacterium]|nr:hypothetical protein [Planctomycetota bacterium]